MFRDKGCQEEFLEKKRNKIRDTERKLLLEDINRREVNEGTGPCIVLDYNLQTRDVETIINKYW